MEDCLCAGMANNPQTSGAQVVLPLILIFFPNVFVRNRSHVGFATDKLHDAFLLNTVQSSTCLLRGFYCEVILLYYHPPKEEKE